MTVQRPAALLLLAIAVLLALAGFVQASHFRGGSISVDTVAMQPSDGTAQLHVSGWQAYRTSYFPAPVTVGDQILLQNPSDGNRLHGWDGGSAPVALKVTTVNPNDDWFTADVLTGPTTHSCWYDHSCAAPGPPGPPPPPPPPVPCPDCTVGPPPAGPASDSSPPTLVPPGAGFPSDYDAVWDPVLSDPPATAGTWWAACCRLGASGQDEHIDNPRGGIALHSQVRFLPGEHGPRVLMPPIIDCPASGICQFIVPATDPDHHALTYSLSPPGIASAWFYDGEPAFHHPGPPDAPNAATIDAQSGEFHWDTAGASLASAGHRTYYSTQVLVFDGTSTTPVDFLIHLVPARPPRPAWSAPCTDLEASITAGNPYHQVVHLTGTHLGDELQTYELGVPEGMRIEWREVADGLEATIDWPTDMGAFGSHIVVFVAYGPGGNQSGLCTLRIHVRGPPMPPFVIAPNRLTVRPGDLVTFPVLAVDPDHDDPVQLTSGGLPTGATLTPQGTDQGTFSWTPGEAGFVSLSFRATDALGMHGDHEVTIKILGERPDADRDGVSDDQDNCRESANQDQRDLDRDGRGDLCDEERDGDGVPNSRDVCPDLADPDQADADRDGIGDACADAEVARPPKIQGDQDGDGVADADDLCPAQADAEQFDLDGDGAGDACDPDADGDGVLDAPSEGLFTDNCLRTANPDQADADQDGVGDACSRSYAHAAPKPGDMHRVAASLPGQAGSPVPALAGLAGFGIATAGVAVVALAGRRR